LNNRRNYEDIKTGDRTAFGKTISEADIFAFCGITGDFNPIHVDEVFARQSRWQGRIAHGMLVAGMVTQTLSALLGDGAVHVSQEVSFKAPVRIGDTITVVSEVTEKIEDRRRVLVSSVWTNQDGVTVITGRGELLLPRERQGCGE
jgi:3-hydroxybutyryl-CoA dehydratase